MDGQSLTGNRNGKQIYGTVKLKDEIREFMNCAIKISSLVSDTFALIHDFCDMKKNILILLIFLIAPFISFSQAPNNLFVNLVYSNSAIVQWERHTVRS